MLPQGLEARLGEGHSEDEDASDVSSSSQDSDHPPDEPKETKKQQGRGVVKLRASLHDTRHEPEVC